MSSIAKVESPSGPSHSLVEPGSQEGIGDHFMKIIAFLEGTENIEDKEEMVEWVTTLKKSEMTGLLNALRLHSRSRTAAIASASAFGLAQDMYAKAQEQWDLSVEDYRRTTIHTARFVSKTMGSSDPQAIPSHARRIQGLVSQVNDCTYANYALER